MANISVLVRARPLLQNEIESGSEVIISMERKDTYLNYVKEDHSGESIGHPKRGSFSQKQFTFDRCFWSVNREDEHFSDQEDIFNEYGRTVVKTAIQGYNACVLAYGQTGSGKSYTMMGSQRNNGLIPKICQVIIIFLR